METLEQMKNRLRQQVLNGTKAAPAPVVTAAPVIVTVPEHKTETKAQDFTREAWLERAWSEIQGLFGIVTPNVRLSVGFPRGKRATSAWSKCVVKAVDTVDNKPQVFVSPIASDAKTVLTVLFCIACDLNGLKSPVLSVDSSGALTITQADENLLKPILERLPAYPHAAVKQDAYKPRDSGGVKVFCSTSGYKVRIAQAWLTKLGAPICPCCNARMSVEA